MKKILAVEMYGDFDIPVTHTLLEIPTGNYDIKVLLSEFLEEQKKKEDPLQGGLTKAIVESNGISRVRSSSDFSRYTSNLIDFLIRKGFSRVKMKRIIISD